MRELDTPTAKRLLDSTVPARLAFAGAGGQPHVLPIWFLWRDGAVVMVSRDDAAKVRAIRREPRIEVSIDSEEPPYRVLRLRGRAELEVVDGVPEEYVICAHRYYGKTAGERWIAYTRANVERMARIILRPEWVQCWDSGERFPELFD